LTSIQARLTIYLSVVPDFKTAVGWSTGGQIGQEGGVVTVGIGGVDVGIGVFVGVATPTGRTEKVL